MTGSVSQISGFQGRRGSGRAVSKTGPVGRGSQFSPRPFRCGFTFVELVLRLAVIYILAALNRVAVQQVREPARRNQWKNNLQQLMLALHGYHDVHQRIPINTGFSHYLGSAHPAAKPDASKTVVHPTRCIAVATRRRRDQSNRAVVATAMHCLRVARKLA